MKLKPSYPIPYDLLLLADPSLEQIHSYLPFGKCYSVYVEGELIGAVVLLPINESKVEIKNIAIAPFYQGKGYGKQLLQKVMDLAKVESYKTIRIGTANSSIGQLALYQKVGFEMQKMLFNFFLDNYEEAIYENGIQAKHMILLEKSL
jgi:aminoglycoside 6'-N-acetyltransferase I